MALQSPDDGQYYYRDIAGTVEETFGLWREFRVGFSWRSYYLDHTLQVQNLAMRMARELDADPVILRHAAILHDISKRYDGAILKDGAGNTVLNEEGFWLNETVPPERSNWVTGLYDRLGLAGQIHHISGAILAEHVLREFGLAENFVLPVTKVIRGHLKGSAPPEVQDERYREVEVRILYDADTIDPNVGYTAFYRNIQINAGAALQRGESVDLRSYVERLDRWIGMKDGFRDQMLTEREREICEERQERNRALHRALLAELEQEPIGVRYGLLGVVKHLFTRPEDPSLRMHADTLREEWLPARERELAVEHELDRDECAQALERASAFSALLDQELAGEA
jgi:putative nucleotidyltransferase with HDIG domain